MSSSHGETPGKIKQSTASNIPFQNKAGPSTRQVNPDPRKPSTSAGDATKTSNATPPSQL